jgi:hypothetical protein
MSKNRFSSLKKQVEVKQQFHYYKYIVVGHSTAALHVLAALRSQGHEGDTILWITEKEVNFNYIERPLPTTIRGERNISLARDLYREEAFVDTTSVFYKDMKFRSFSGRSKSMPLLLGEVFYTAPGLIFKEQPEGLVNPEQFTSWQKVVALDSVSFEESTEDLLNPKQWSLQTKGDEVLQCHYLIWATEPLSFYSYLSSSQQKIFKVIPEFLNESEEVTELYISFEFDKKVTDQTETFFIPLSLTHSEGHFIGQFQETSAGQRADFIHFFDEDDCDENEVIRKIKTLKRSLEKIFEVPRGVNYLKEFYSIDKVGVASVYRFLDAKADVLFSQFPTLLFIGENAPLKWNSGLEQESVSHMMREKLSLDFATSVLLTN